MSRSKSTGAPAVFPFVSGSSWPAATGTASVDSGSRKACSMRWVWNVSSKTCAAEANASSASPLA